jgi:S1-C subfamily serine protease
MMAKRLGCIALCLVLSAIIAFLAYYQAPKKRDAFAISTVKVLAGEGHGSGVHTGNRYIITAAHVVGSLKTVRVKAKHGGESEADVLWVNKAHDIALLRARELQGVAVSQIECGVPAIGQHIEAVGAPGPLEFIHAFGRVASDVQSNPHWASYFVAAMVVGPGMSGGPVFDARGKVVGIVVGVALTQLGWTASALALAYVVPSQTVCNLTMRSA